jgi:hypothetical protein
MNLAVWVRNLSTNKVTFKLKHEILNVLNNKIYVAGIFCGVAKAFVDLNLMMLQNYFVIG